MFAAVVFISFLFLVCNGALSWGRPSDWSAACRPGTSDSTIARITAGPGGPGGPGDPSGPALRPTPDHRSVAPTTGEPAASGRTRPGRVERRGPSTMGLEDLQHNFLTGPLEDLVKWARTYSMWPATFGLACCAIEMMSVGAADFDLARFGMEVFRASPRQADLMIVAGRVSQKMAPVLRQVYDQMMEPKWVISMGVCASTGGMFNNYAIVQGVDQIVPVDVYAPGCPPDPGDPDARHPHPPREGPDRRHHPPRTSAHGRPGMSTGRTRAAIPTTPGPRRRRHLGWNPDRPDAVHLGTPKRNPIIARSVGEPL